MLQSHCNEASLSHQMSQLAEKKKMSDMTRGRGNRSMWNRMSITAQAKTPWPRSLPQQQVLQRQQVLHIVKDPV